MEIKKTRGKRFAGSTVYYVLILIVTSSMLKAGVSAKNVVLTFRQEGKDFEDVFKGLREELQDEFELQEVIVSKKTTDEAFAEPIKKINPKCIVLMDNVSIALYRKYQGTLAADVTPPPSVSLMGVMIGEAVHDLRNAAGISYEIPIVTSVVSLRSILGTPMKKVGVVNREFLREFLGNNTGFCKQEGIEIIGKTLPNKSDAFRNILKEALGALLDQKMDVLWIPNDIVLLQPELIQNVWLPAVRKYKIPVIVGVEVLVSPKINLGTFAVLPDHVALGSQAAEMVYEIKDNNWLVDGRRVDPPLAVYKIINLQQARKNFNVSDEKLNTVDKLIK